MANLNEQADMNDATAILGNCKECATPLVRKGAGPLPTYCSANCRAKASARRAKADGRDKQWTATARAKSEAEREANAKPCPYCGDPITSQRRIQCGKPECKRLYRNQRQAEFQQKHKAETGQYYSRTYVYERTCIQCGPVWKTGYSKAKYCSNTCQAEREHGADRIGKKNKAAHIKRRRILRRIAKAAEGTRGALPFVAGPCASCGALLITRRPDIRWCSPACKQREKAIRRRAREYDAFIEDVPRLVVFERDNWDCQICGEPVDPETQVPNALAPTIDHIIPLARGGTHELINLQLAHFICNSRKRDILDAALTPDLCDSP